MVKMYHIIMAGGIGSRFWPMSRKNKPKQFLNLINNDNLINLTYKRLLNFSDPSQIVIITSQEYQNKIKKQFPDIPANNIIYEPSPKNTASAIYLAAKYICSLDENASMGVYPSDHFIKKENKFTDTINRISHFLDNKLNSIITIGIDPNFPSTSYGYINFDHKKNEEIFKVNKFLEKPNFKKAESLISEKNNLWNSGTFFSKAKTLINEVDLYVPDFKRLYAKIDSFMDYKKIWDEMPKISIDYAVMEKTTEAYCIKGTFDWTDLGTWVALYGLLQKDQNGNAYQGNIISFDSSNNLIISKNKLTSVVGLNNVAIINLDDATLVIDLFKSEEVRNIIDLIDERYK